MSSTDVLESFRGAEPPPSGQPEPTLDMERVVRRELSPSRAILSGIAAFIVTVLAIYALLETGLRIANQPAWLIDPQSALDRFAQFPQGTNPLLLSVIGVLLLLMGAVFFGNGVVKSRRARHTLIDPRIAVVVDDEVIASALARRARLTAGVTQEQVVVAVSKRLVVVDVRPTSGVPLDGDAIRLAIEQELQEMRPMPIPQVRINIATVGVIGV